MDELNEGERLKELRTAMGLSQADFGEMMEIDRVYLSHIERGAKPMNGRIETWERLAKGVGVSIERLREYFDGSIKAETLLKGRAK